MSLTTVPSLSQPSQNKVLRPLHPSDREKLEAIHHRVQATIASWDPQYNVPVDFQVNTTPVLLADIFTIPLLPTTEERMSVVGRFHCAYLRVLVR
jgi:hypothetical protein